MIRGSFFNKNYDVETNVQRENKTLCLPSNISNNVCLVNIMYYDEAPDTGPNYLLILFTVNFCSQ